MELSCRNFEKLGYFTTLKRLLQKCYMATMEALLANLPHTRPIISKEIEMVANYQRK
jgi:hypothetical protein